MIINTEDCTFIFWLFIMKKISFILSSQLDILDFFYLHHYKFFIFINQLLSLICESILFSNRTSDFSSISVLKVSANSLSSSRKFTIFSFVIRVTKLNFDFSIHSICLLYKKSEMKKNINK